jgi:peptidoglycan/xylan/chitin deacetylase (PgdA/CDA1 family)
VIPLRQLAAYRLGTDMFPLVKDYRIPVTLFVYPSAISNAPYAMTWEQLRELQESGLFEIQSHTYWHPNFRKEKQRLSPERYEQFVRWQLTSTKERLERKLGIHVDMLAWPFGIYDDELITYAQEAGYVVALTLKRRRATTADHLMALPRYLMTDRDRGKAFEQLVAGGAAQRKGGY